MNDTVLHQPEAHKYSVQVKLDFCIVYNLWNYGLYAPNLLNIVKVCCFLFIGSIAISNILSNHLKEFRMSVLQN